MAMNIETSQGRYAMKPEQVADELTYRSYAFNRRTNPDVPVNRWMSIFSNVPEMEVRYQTERMQ